MNAGEPERWDVAGAVVLWLATATVVVLLLPLGLHPDDVGVMQFVSQHGYGDVWTTPFMRLFYRPLVVTIAKLGTDLFGPGALPLRVLQGALVSAIILSFVGLLRESAGRFARSAGGLCLLASPLVFVTVTPFAVGVADTIVLLSFLIAVRLALVQQGSEPGTLWSFIGLSIVAVLAKESGVLVVAFCVAESVRRRAWAASTALLALGGAYLAVRSSFVHVQPYGFKTGFLLGMYGPRELRSMFGESPYLFYLYNVACNLSSALFYIPVKGQLRVSLRIAVVAVVVTATSLVAMRQLVRSGEYRRWMPLLGVLFLNAVLGYLYVRARIMFVGYAVIAIFFVRAMDDLWKRPQQLLGLSGRSIAVTLWLSWIGLWVAVIVRLRLQAAAALDATIAS